MSAVQRAAPLAGLARPDTTTLTVLTVWLLFLLPARLIVTSLGAVGQPALLVSALAPLLWLYGRSFAVAGIDRAPNPVRWLLVTYLAYLVFNFAWLQTRTQTELETSSSIRSLLVSFVLVGLALLVCDATSHRERLDAIVRAITFGATVAALIAFVQFFFDLDLPALLRLPGLSYGPTEFVGIGERGGLNRTAGPMSHPIELGVVLGAVLPLAVHAARFASRRPRWTWLAVGIIAAASMLSISRSGIISAVVALGILALAWSWRQRANAGAAAVGLIGVMWVMVPGLVTTFRWFFTNVGTEDSAQARVDRFPLVLDVASQRPFLGRGIGTFTVDEGLLLDQQLYQTFVELGLVGIVVTITLVAMAVVAGFAVWRHGDPHAETGHLALAFTGTVAALAVTGLTYTAFFYRVHYTLLLVAIGCLGCLWRFGMREESQQTARV